MELFKGEVTPFMRQVAALLRDAAYELQMAVDRLAQHPNVAGDHVLREKALENRVEDVHREVLADLFSGANDFEHVITILKLREVSRQGLKQVIHVPGIRRRLDHNPVTRLHVLPQPHFQIRMFHPHHLHHFLPILAHSPNH